MILTGAAALLLLVFGSSQEQSRPPQPGAVTVRHHLIIRVSRGVSQAAPAGASAINWREGRGPRCVST